MKQLVAVYFVAGFAVGLASAGNCPRFHPGRKVGIVESKLIREASGLAISRKNEDVRLGEDILNHPARLVAQQFHGIFQA